jgi:hypothetical protein
MTTVTNEVKDDAPANLPEEDMLFQEEPKTFDNNLTGSLFRNSKRTSDKHPNAKGRCEIAGRHYWIASWTKKTGTPEAFMSLAFTELTPEEVIHYVK